MASRTVSVALVADVGQYQSAMVRAASSTKAVGASATTAGEQANRGFQAAGQGVRLLQAALVGGLALGLKSTVDAAADAEQSIGGAQAVFKDYAGTVIASSKEADRALGLSANSYRELATIIGSQMKNAGVPMEELADKTEGIIGIGADLAAQFGGSTQSAVEALSSAFRGELDPIERYGISLTAAAVGAKAVEMGLAESESELDQNAKAMATLAIVTEQSADAQGAFSREADTAAGRAQRASAQWENLKVAVGDKLLPAWSALVDVLGTKVIPLMGDALEVVSSAVGAFADLDAPVQVAIGAFGAWSLAGDRVMGGLSAIGNSLSPLRDGTRAFGEALDYARANGDGMGTVLRSVGDYAGGAMLNSMKNLAKAIGPALGFAAAAYLATEIYGVATAADDAREEIKQLWDAVDDARGSAQFEALSDNVEKIESKIASLRENLSDDGAWETTILGALLTGALEDSKALEEYEQALRRAEAAQRDAVKTANTLGNWFGLNRDQVLDLAEKYNIDLTQGTQNAYMQFQAFYTTEFGNGPMNSTRKLNESLMTMADVTATAEERIDALKTALDILGGATVSVFEAQSALQQVVASATGALEGLTGSVLDGNGKLNAYSESGRAAGDVLVNIRDKGNDLITTMVEQGATLDETRAADARLRQSFIDSAMQMGISQDAARRLADEILGVPEERETRFTAATDQAAAKIAALQAQINEVSRDRTASINFRATLPDLNGVASGSGRMGTYADGGYTGPGGKYDVAGLVHAGEYVFTKEQVSRLGVNRLEEIANNGYAGGGLVSLNGLADTSGASAGLVRTMNVLGSSVEAAARRLAEGVPGSGGLGGAWGSIWDFVRSRVPQARINSTFRAGDPGYHGRGKAIDFGFGSGPGGNGSAGLALINRVLHDGVGRNLAELIYDGIGDDRPDLKNGRPLTYNASTRAAHRNHVHAAVYDQGGTMQHGTAGINLSGFPERVLNPRETSAYEAGLRAREFSGASGGAGGTVVKLSLADLNGLPITGRFVMDPDGLVRIVDGRIDARQSATARSERGWQ